MMNSLFTLVKRTIEKNALGANSTLVGGGLIWSKWTDLFGYPLKMCQILPNDGKKTFFGVEIIFKGVYPGFYK